jgi:hypothetical protein
VGVASSFQIIKVMHEIHCGLLPLANRFIVVKLKETVWSIPAAAIITLTTAYYEEEGWYEQCELDEGAIQPHGEELRGVVEVNADLDAHTKDARWTEVEDVATLLSGERIVPPDNDKLWWFEENGGTIDEMTDLPIENQIPLRLLWFDEEFRLTHNIQVT